MLLRDPQWRVSESCHDPEITLATIMNEMRTVKDECNRLRNIVEQVGGRHVDALRTIQSSCL